MTRLKHALAITVALVSFSCSPKPEGAVVSIENNTNLERKSETVSIPADALKAKGLDLSSILVAENSENGAFYAVQLNKDESGSVTSALFQPEMPGSTRSEFVIRNLKKGEAGPVEAINCFSRFVPERIDDYAWENDRVAFRTYGPEAQRLTEARQPGGTLSSGIDCWLKKVDYPIIDKWYKNHTEGITYHEDHGEGLDNYHVGGSRGCGGTMVFDEETKKMYAAKNFISHKKIEDGVFRTSFILDYAPYATDGDSVKETKFISIDKGSNLTRYEVSVNGSDKLTVGITLHEKNGAIDMDESAAWFNYNETEYFGSELNTAVVVDPDYLAGYEKYIVNRPDKSHILVHLKAIDGKVVFYSGFFWKESKQFPSLDDWKHYLSDFALQLSEPLQVSVD